MDSSKVDTTKVEDMVNKVVTVNKVATTKEDMVVSKVASKAATVVLLPHPLTEVAPHSKSFGIGSRLLTLTIVVS
jgi:hypothetical protein